MFSFCIPSSPCYQVPIPLGSDITLNTSIATLTEQLCVHEQSMNHISMKKKKQALMSCEKRSTNTRPNQLCWGDREMGTAISRILP